MNRRQILKKFVLAPMVLALSMAGGINAASAATGAAEKPQLKFGFIKLTDMAPLAVAYEKHFFED